MKVQNYPKYLAEVDVRELSPELLRILKSKLSARGPTPDEAIVTLRTQLEGVLQRQGVYVMEGEGFSDHEKSLITALRNSPKKGVKDFETEVLLIAWISAQESLAEAAGTPEARIAFERSRAILHWNSGFHEEADQAWEDGLMIAQQEGKSDLHLAIVDEITAFRFE